MSKFSFPSVLCEHNVCVRFLKEIYLRGCVVPLSFIEIIMLKKFEEAFDINTNPKTGLGHILKMNILEY